MRAALLLLGCMLTATVGAAPLPPPARAEVDALLSRLQSSGSDQWGNVVSGIDLGRRMENVQLFGLTTPLITTSSGAKMGKSVSGAVWLNADMRSPYDYWQFWRNTEDGDVGRFMRIFTDMPIAESRASKSCRARN